MNRLADFAIALQHSQTLDALLPIIAKVTVIALIGRLLMTALPKASASMRYLIALTTFCSMLLTPFLALSGPTWKVALLPPDPVVAAASAPVSAPGIESEPSGKSRALPRALPAPIRTTISFVDSVRNGWIGWLLLLSAAIAIGFLGRMIFGIAAIAWVTRNASEIEDDALVRDFEWACEALGVGRFVRVLSSERVTVPLMWGVQQPVLLLPAQSLQWTRDRLRVIFLHELAHLRRGDAVTLLLTRVATALYWFHPLAWSLDRAARRECEQACDDLVLTSGTRASDYADHLLEIARTLPNHDPFGAVTLAMSRRSQLEGRLLSILEPHAARGAVSLRAVVFAALAASTVVLPIAAMRLVAQPQEAPSPGAEVKSGSVVSVIADAGERKTEIEKELVGRSGAYWFERGRKAYSEEHLVESVDAYKKAIAAGYKPAIAMYNIACIYSIESNPDEALVWLQKSLNAGFDQVSTIESDDDLDPIRSDPRFQRMVAGIIRTSADRKVTESVENYDALRASHSDNASEWSEAGTCLLKVRETTKAIDAFNEALRLEPFQSTAMYNLACAYALQGDSRRALDTVEQAVLRGFNDSEKITRDPDLAPIRGARLNEIAELAADLELNSLGHKFRQNVPRYEEMTRKHPTAGRAWFNLGFVRLEADDARGSIEAFMRALQLGHRPATTSYNLACANAVAGNRDVAFDWLAKASTAGFKVEQQACHDDDLDNLRDDPRFRAYKTECNDFEWKKELHEKHEQETKKRAE